MTDSCPQRETLLILFSISICVVALFITPVGATADHAEETDSLKLDFEEPDRVFASYEDLTRTSVWQGQKIQIDLIDASVEEGDTVFVYERIDDESSRLVAETIADESGMITLESDTYSQGNYYLTGAGDLPTRSEAYEDIALTFGVNEQSLSADFNRDIVTDKGPISTTEFEVDSNRRTYPITIHAEDDLNPNELTEIFVNQGPFELRYTAEGNDGVTDFDEIGIEPVPDFDEYEVGFEDIEAGNYEFIFTVTDSTVETNDEITINLDDEFNVDPTAAFTYEPDFPDLGETVTFDASGSEDIDGEIVEYQWDFNGDGSTDATGETVSHTYHSEGFYDVSLTVVDDDGATSDALQLVGVATNENQIQNPEATQGVVAPPHTVKQSYDELTNELIWQGQVVAVDGFEPHHNNIQLRERIDESTTRLRAEISSDANGTVMFGTKDHTSRDYFLRGGGVNIDGTDLSDTFEITEQSLIARFEEQTVSQTGSDSQTSFEFDSNRATYPINITTTDGSLHAVQLANLFNAATINGEEAFDVINMEAQGNDKITITANGTTGISDSNEYKIDFENTDIETGEYEFIFSGADTTASSTDAITVGESNGPGEDPEDPDEVHESGVNQKLFDAVDQSGDGEVNLGELRDAVEQWGDAGQINSVDASLGDMRALVDWSLS